MQHRLPGEPQGTGPGHRTLCAPLAPARRAHPCPSNRADDQSRDFLDPFLVFCGRARERVPSALPPGRGGKHTHVLAKPPQRSRPTLARLDLCWLSSPRTSATVATGSSPYAEEWSGISSLSAGRLPSPAARVGPGFRCQAIAEEATSVRYPL